MAQVNLDMEEYQAMKRELEDAKNRLASYESGAPILRLKVDDAFDISGEAEKILKDYSEFLSKSFEKAKELHLTEAMLLAEDRDKYNKAIVNLEEEYNKKIEIVTHNLNHNADKTIVSYMKKLKEVETTVAEEYKERFDKLNFLVDKLNKEKADIKNKNKALQNDYTKLMEEYIQNNKVTELENTIENLEINLEIARKRPNIRLNWFTRLFIKYDE